MPRAPLLVLAFISSASPLLSSFAHSRNICRMASTAASASFASRSVQRTVLSKAQGEGQGATVRRSIGRREVGYFDPFLMLDEFFVTKPAGFPDHPHRGFETVTFMLQGSFMHEDFKGNAGTIGPGDLQWMTAGRGILHSEMPATNELNHGLQLWVNLKSSDKMVEPAYQELKNEQVPEATQGGVVAKIIAGEAFGVQSPVYTRTPTHYIHFRMEANSQLDQPIPAGWNSFLYIISGNVKVGSSNTIEAHNLILLDQVGDGATVRTEGEAAEFVIISGEPIGEPVAQHGPFVMNTRDEIVQTFRDYEMNVNGFEGARRWKSKIGAEL